MNQLTVSFKTLLMAAALTLPGLAMAAEPAMMKDGMMVDQKGMTLYTFDKDKDGKSMCNGECAEYWPPMMAPAGARTEGKWTVINREDGKAQYAYDGKPLYTFSKDKAPGEMKGDNMKDVWHVVHESQK